METPKEYHYTYYSYEEWGMGYFGVRTCECLPEEDVKYFGSYTDKTFKPNRKIILKDDYPTREDANADEIILQEYYKVVENPHFANRAYQTSTKFYVPTEQAIENGKKGGEKCKELKLGVCGLSKKERSETGKKSGQKTYELGVGIHSLTFKERSETGKKSGQKTYEQKLGIYSRSNEKVIEDSKKAGKKSYELGAGIHSLTKEQRIENGKKYGSKAGKIGSTKTNSQKWMCLETGYTTNSGALTRYQKARGIDTSRRMRLS